MQVKPISVTKSLIEGHENLTAEEVIIFAARASNPSNQLNSDTAPRLIAYLIRVQHWSPFEMANLCVEIKTSRAIAQQILRHRSFSFQEFSQRYAQVVDIEPVQLRKQAVKNRQSSTEEFDPLIDVSRKLTPVRASWAIGDAIKYMKELYATLINEGVAKECARMILPLTTETTIYMNGSVRSWIHYIAQRTDPHAQLEHQLVALEVEKIFAKQFPNIFEAIELAKSKAVATNELIEEVKKLVEKENGFGYFEDLLRTINK